MPFRNYHSCRLNEPNYENYARVNCDQKHDAKCIDVVYGISGEGENRKSEIQALRYDKAEWNAASARKHCASRGGQFEQAKKTTESIQEDINEEVRIYGAEVKIIESCDLMLKESNDNDDDDDDNGEEIETEEEEEEEEIPDGAVVADLAALVETHLTEVLAQVTHPDSGETVWALKSKTTSKVLKYYGKNKPSDDQVLADERRVQFFKHKQSAPINPSKLEKEHLKMNVFFNEATKEC